MVGLRELLILGSALSPVDSFQTHDVISKFSNEIVQATEQREYSKESFMRKVDQLNNKRLEKIITRLGLLYKKYGELAGSFIEDYQKAIFEENSSLKVDEYIKFGKQFIDNLCDLESNSNDNFGLNSCNEFMIRTYIQKEHRKLLNMINGNNTTTI